MLAKGLAIQKMNPGDAVKVIKEWEKEKVADRLRLYFFPETLWDRLPETAKRALISADREYESPLGLRPSILGHLEDAVRRVLVQEIVNSFRGYKRGTDAEDDLSEMLLLWKRKKFREFVVGHFGDADGNWLVNLEDDLWLLHRLYNKKKHLHTMSPSEFETDVKEQYRKFLGIGCRGVLPRLMAMRPLSS